MRKRVPGICLIILVTLVPAMLLAVFNPRGLSLEADGYNKNNLLQVHVAKQWRLYKADPMRLDANPLKATSLTKFISLDQNTLDDIWRSFYTYYNAPLTKDIRSILDTWYFSNKTMMVLYNYLYIFVSIKGVHDEDEMIFRLTVPWDIPDTLWRKSCYRRKLWNLK